MTGWSLSLGTIFGVKIRLHSLFAYLLVAAMFWASFLHRPVSRGLAVWALVLLAVGVREIARALVAAWFGLELESILLLPTGGIFSLSTRPGSQRAGQAVVERTLALTGPVVSLLFGLTVAALIWTVAPEVSLLHVRWVTPEHLLRSMVWINLLLAAINLLPVWPFDGAHLLHTALGRAPSQAVEGDADAREERPAPAILRGASLRGAALGSLKGIGPAIAIGLLILGMLSVNWWLIVAGMAVLFGAQVERQGLATGAGADAVPVREVMLTDYTFLSASATLEDAARRARQTLQDVFPVVRGNNIVGAVARQTVMDALATTGNGYVQGVMARTFHAATPDEPLLTALGRLAGGEGGASSQLIPVILGDRVVGIVTPQNLGRAVGFMARRSQTQSERSGRS